MLSLVGALKTKTHYFLTKNDINFTLMLHHLKALTLNIKIYKLFFKLISLMKMHGGFNLAKENVSKHPQYADFQVNKTCHWAPNY